MKHTLWASLFLSAALSCTNIYFEKPVPQNGQPLLAPPQGLQGAYEILGLNDENEEPDPLEAWLKPCYYFEKLDDGRLLISEDIRFHERDLISIKAYLAEKKADGTLAGYTVSERSIHYTTAADTAGKQSSAYAPMIKSGSWYILTRTQKPVRMFGFDPKNAFQINFEVKNGGGDGFLPDTDSLSIDTSVLVARQRAGAFFLNTQAAGSSNWSLIYCTQDVQGDVQMKFSSMGFGSDSLIENNRAHYEAITHFAKTPNDHYLINPDDPALDLLLADPQLFKTMRLRKLKE